MIKNRIEESILVKQKILADAPLIRSVEEACRLLTKTFRSGGKVFFCGNGGSAADAQHLAAEFSGRFYYDRPPLPAEALHVNSSFITAVSNDYSWEDAYARYIRAQGRKGDVLVAISTSGNSPNILKAMKEARTMDLRVIGLTGAGGGKMKELADLLLPVPSDETPRIQEAHILLGHILCEQVEKELFPRS